eukprot:1381819-Amphidinium_carterae.1
MQLSVYNDSKAKRPLSPAEHRTGIAPAIAFRPPLPVACLPHSEVHPWGAPENHLCAPNQSL